MLITLLAAVVVLGILIFVHELGHFLAMRRARVRVETFSFGFGPRVAGFRRGETDFIISLLPFGGYVKPAGENPDEQGLTGAPWEFLSKPWWVRASIFACGPLMNIALALVLNIAIGMVGVRISDYPPVVGRVMSGSLAEKAGFEVADQILAFVPFGTPAETTTIRTWHQLTTGYRPEGTIIVQRGAQRLPLPVRASREEPWTAGLDPTILPVVGGVSVGLPAYQAGIQRGDRVLSIDGKQVNTWYEASELIHQRPGRRIELDIERGGKKITVVVTTIAQEMPEQGTIGLIGIQPPQAGSYVYRLGPGASVAGGALLTGHTIIATYVGLWKMVIHPTLIPQGLGGPIMIAQMSGQEARAGWDRLLSFVAVISIALAVLNFLPIPVLDGGHILFCFVEALRGRPFAIRTQVNLQKIGLVLLLLLVAFTTYNDVSRVTERTKAIEQQR
jgi:regulator of sigma E protease